MKHFCSSSEERNVLLVILITACAGLVLVVVGLSVCVLRQRRVKNGNTHGE